MTRLALYILLTLPFVTSGLAQSRTSKLPKGLVNKIQDDLGDCMSQYEGGKKELLRYLTAKRVDLNNDKHVEYIVEGEDMGKCISGNKFHSIWVYRKMKSDFEMILASSSTNVTVLRTFTKGYKDIKETSVDGPTTYTRIHKFDGHKYQPDR